MNKLIFLGAPGVGKGTMAEKLADDKGLTHISTGQILREEIAAGSDLGNEVKGIMEAGQLVPDKTVATIVASVIGNPEIAERGFILDGFPRTVEQAEILAEIMKKESIQLDAAVLFSADEELLLKRLTGRRVCKDCSSTLHHELYNPPKIEGICDKCGGELYQRKDDTIETATDRLEVYNKVTFPVVGFYQQADKIIEIDTTDSRDIVYANLLIALGL